jgi:hypothetical protein
MRLTHLLTFAALLCAGQAFAQTTSNSSLAAAQGIASIVPSDSAVDQFLISPFPQLDFIAQNTPADNSADRMQEDPYNPDQRVTSLPPFPGPDISCLRIRSYRVARDNRDSDSTHLVSYTTCVRAENLRVYRTVVHPQEDGR